MSEGKEGLFWEGSIRASGHTVRHTPFSDGELFGREGQAGKKVQKTLHFYTVFWDVPDIQPNCQNTQEFWRCKTLMYAFGRQISDQMGAGMWEMKRRAVLGVGISAFP
ncbi:MAG: hypothetical protein WC342_05245 [Methanoregula sp.]